MALRLDWCNEQDAVPLPEGIGSKFSQLLAAAGEMENIAEGEVVLTIVDDEEIRRLNREYRGLDQPTDVLSFSMWETGDGEMDVVFEESAAGGKVCPEQPIGDIIISAETAKRQSEAYGHSFERELGFLFIHGFLHLIGYDHDDPESERIMTEKQERALERVGLFR